MKHQRKQRRGAAAIEFALTLPVMMSILLGIIEYGYYFSERQVLYNIVAESCGEEYYAEAEDIFLNYFSSCPACAATLTEDPMRYVCDMVKPYDQITGFFPADIMPTAYNIRAVKRKTQEQIEETGGYYY